MGLHTWLRRLGLVEPMIGVCPVCGATYKLDPSQTQTCHATLEWVPEANP